MTELIAYYRVSTAKQGDSGLGLEGQKAAVEAYARLAGATIKADYTEVESGRKTDRPAFHQALGHARRSKAVFVVAKLDRLVRNYPFLRDLERSGVKFVACDNPNVNKMTVRILGVVAEDEAERISERTKAGLAALKARGVLLGSARPGHWKGREELRLAGLAKATAASAKARRQEAEEFYADLLTQMQKSRAAGMSLAAIAAKLNEQGHTTRRGKPWSPMQVKLVLDRAKQTTGGAA